MFFDDCSDLFRELLSRDVDIPCGRFMYPCRFKFNPEAKYLSVQLHGTTPRGEGTALPVFARWNWGKILGAHVLSICDPTIYLDETLRIGWYLGVKEESAMPGIVAIAQKCAETIGIAPDRIIFSGGSGGGFAALQAAGLTPNGKAIAINPQTDLSQYAQEHVANYIDKVSGCFSVEEVQRLYGSRWNAIRSVQEACDRGNPPRIVYVQNTNEWHYSKHFLPFAEAFCLNPKSEKSVNGNFMSFLYSGPPEHGPEPMEVVKQINRQALPFLLNINIDTEIPEFSTKIESMPATGQIIATIYMASDKAEIYQFACYLQRNGEVVEKRFYQTDIKFLFNVDQPGSYKCLGFLRDKNGLSFSVLSEPIRLPNQ